MRIVIDARMLGWSGIGRYISNLLDELQQLDHDNEYIVLLSTKEFSAWQPTAANFRKVRADALPYSLGEQLRLPRLIKRLHPDLVHFTHFTVPLTYRGRFVVTIHDLTLLDYRNVQGRGIIKRWLYGAKYRVMKRVIGRAIRRAERIIVPTHYAASEIGQRYRVPSERLTVTYEAAASVAAQAQTPPQPTPAKPFVLHVGNYYPYKNLWRLIQAVAGLKDPSTKLVLAGRADYFQRELEDRVQRTGLGNRVIFTGFVSDEELAWLYHHATAFVFPSLSEGFGLPGLEAMAYGLPVLASQASCLPEVYGEAAQYFDPHNVADIATQLERVLSELELRQELIQAGTKRLKDFSWQKMAQETLEVYRQVGA